MVEKQTNVGYLGKSISYTDTQIYRHALRREGKRRHTMTHTVWRRPSITFNRASRIEVIPIAFAT